MLVLGTKETSAHQLSAGLVRGMNLRQRGYRWTIGKKNGIEWGILFGSVGIIFQTGIEAVESKISF